MTQGKCEACRQSGIEKVCNHCPDFIPPKEKRYAVVEVGGRNCALLSHDNICTQGGNCETCTKGQTLQEMVESMARGAYSSTPFINECGEIIWEKLREPRKCEFRNIIKAALSTLIPQEEK